MAIRRWPRRLGMTALTLVVVVVLAASSLLTWSVYRAWPQVEGEARLPGLDAPVEVLRDDLGVAHIYASTSADLYRVQGWVHAQDRFWQMDAWRHITAGRAAPALGLAYSVVGLVNQAYEPRRGPLSTRSRSPSSWPGTPPTS